MPKSTRDSSGDSTWYAYIVYKDLTPNELVRIEGMLRKGTPVATLPVETLGDSYHACLIRHPNILASLGDPSELWVELSKPIPSDQEPALLSLTHDQVKANFIRHGDRVTLDARHNILAVNGLDVTVEENRKRLAFRPFTNTPYLSLNTMGQTGTEFLPFYKADRKKLESSELVRRGFASPDIWKDLDMLQWLFLLVKGATVAVAGSTNLGKTFTMAEFAAAQGQYAADNPDADECVIVLGAAERSKDIASTWLPIVELLKLPEDKFAIFSAPAGMVTPNGAIHYYEFVRHISRRQAEMPGRHCLLLVDSMAGSFTDHNFSTVPKVGSQAAVSKGASMSSLHWLRATFLTNNGRYENGPFVGGTETVMGMFFSPVANDPNDQTFATVALKELRGLVDNIIVFDARASQYPMFGTQGIRLPRQMYFFWQQYRESGHADWVQRWEDGISFIRGDTLGPKPTISPEEMFDRVAAFARLNPFNPEVAPKLVFDGMESVLNLATDPRKLYKSAEGYVEQESKD